MIETKQIPTYEGADYIGDLTAFAWQPTQEVSQRFGRSTRTYQIMARETSIPHYEEYRKLEKDYESARDDIKTYSSMEVSTVLLLLLIFVIPGVIYIAAKMSQKASIEEHNADCYSRMKQAVSKAKNIQ